MPLFYLFWTGVLSDGTLTKKDLLNFYMGEDVKDKYKSIEKEIKEI